jgi:uncharacterized protein
MSYASKRQYLKDPEQYDPADEPRPMPRSPSPPESPCVGVCTMDGEGYCIGCLRSLDEIAQWGRMSSEEQWAVVQDLPQREAAEDS